MCIRVFRYSMQRSHFLQKQLHTWWQGESKRSWGIPSITCSIYLRETTSLLRSLECTYVYLWSAVQQSDQLSCGISYSNCVASVFSPVAGCTVYSAYSTPGIQRWHYRSGLINHPMWFLVSKPKFSATVNHIQREEVNMWCNCWE